MEWSEIIYLLVLAVWAWAVSCIIGGLLYEVKGWIRAKATRELAQAKACLCESFGRTEADKVKLP